MNSSQESAVEQQVERYEQPIDKIDMSNLELYKVQSKSYRNALNKIFFTCLKEIPREVLIEGLKKKKIIKQDWEEKGNKYKVEETK